jgi:septal ring factor EnvC (AmiA/AmiB activator)
MMTLNVTPPQTPSADAVAAALSLISLAVDPTAAKQRIEELARMKADVLDALKKLEDERTRNQRALEAVADLRAREEAVALAAEENQKTSVQLANARAAQQDRESKLQADAAGLQQKIKEHEAAVAAHVRRVEQAKAALG